MLFNNVFVVIRQKPPTVFDGAAFFFNQHLIVASRTLKYSSINQLTCVLTSILAKCPCKFLMVLSIVHILIRHQMSSSCAFRSLSAVCVIYFCLLDANAIQYFLLKIAQVGQTIAWLFGKSSQSLWVVRQSIKDSLNCRPTFPSTHQITLLKYVSLQKQQKKVINIQYKVILM